MRQTLSRATRAFIGATIAGGLRYLRAWYLCQPPSVELTAGPASGIYTPFVVEGMENEAPTPMWWVQEAADGMPWQLKAHCATAEECTMLVEHMADAGPLGPCTVSIQPQYFSDGFLRALEAKEPELEVRAGPALNLERSIWIGWPAYLTVTTQGKSDYAGTYSLFTGLFDVAHRPMYYKTQRLRWCLGPRCHRYIWLYYRHGRWVIRRQKGRIWNIDKMDADRLYDLAIWKGRPRFESQLAGDRRPQELEWKRRDGAAEENPSSDRRRNWDRLLPYGRLLPERSKNLAGSAAALLQEGAGASSHESLCASFPREPLLLRVVPLCGA